MDLWPGGSFYTTLLEAFQEGYQVVIRLINSFAVHWRRLIERLLFELKARMQIHLHGVHRLDLRRDHRRVDPAVKQRHRGTVAQDMRRDSFAL